MTYYYDTVIVGCGPSGSTAARLLAQQGIKVLLVDKRQELGSPIQCSGAVSRHGLTSSGIDPDEEYIQEQIYGFNIFNTTGENHQIDYRKLKPEIYGSGKDKMPLGYIVDRRRFDRCLMGLAENNGAEVWLKTEALGYKPLYNGNCLVQLKKFNSEIEIECRLIIGADGLQSQVGKWAGLRTHIKLTELISCLQFIVDGVETEGLLEIITGNQWAPGGYAWVFPKGNGHAEIGLGIITTLTKNSAQMHLEKFISQSFFRDRFKNMRLLEIQGGGVPLSAPLKTQYAENVLLIGDAARHVNPITGGGIHTALSAGVIAAEFLIPFFQANGKANKQGLKGYQDLWMTKLGTQLWKLYAVKKEFITTKNTEDRDLKLYTTMRHYFQPNSEFKKI